MSYNLSGCVFIRNCFEGAFCLFESMHQLLPLCDEFIVMDLGSTDGTLQALQEIEKSNPKVKLVYSTFYEQDAAIFAKLANDLIAMCSNDTVLYYQADEIWHENLVQMTKDALNRGKKDLSFWRVQLKYNFQLLKWPPHLVHRVAPKDNFNFVIDGMNSDRTFDTNLVSSYDMGMMQKWGDEYKNKPTELPLDEMILDVSLTGAFLENIPERRKMHLPLWHEDVNIPHMPSDEDSMRLDDWMTLQRNNHMWFLSETPFNVPEIIKYHLGKTRYKLRQELLEALKSEGQEIWR